MDEANAVPFSEVLRNLLTHFYLRPDEDTEELLQNLFHDSYEQDPTYAAHFEAARHAAAHYHAPADQDPSHTFLAHWKQWLRATTRRARSGPPDPVLQGRLCVAVYVIAARRFPYAQARPLLDTVIEDLRRAALDRPPVDGLAISQLWRLAPPDAPVRPLVLDVIALDGGLPPEVDTATLPQDFLAPLCRRLSDRLRQVGLKSRLWMDLRWYGSQYLLPENPNAQSP